MKKEKMNKNVWKKLDKTFEKNNEQTVDYSMVVMKIVCWNQRMSYISYDKYGWSEHCYKVFGN